MKVTQVTLYTYIEYQRVALESFNWFTQQIYEVSNKHTCTILYTVCYIRILGNGTITFSKAASHTGEEERRQEKDQQPRLKQ